MGQAASHEGMNVLLLLTLLSVASFGQGLEGTSGTWKMNAARSTFAGAAPFKSLTVRIERHAKGEVFTLDRIETGFRMFRNSIVTASGRADGGDRAHVRERGVDAASAACLGEDERTRSGDYGAIRGWPPFREAPDAREAIGVCGGAPGQDFRG